MIPRQFAISIATLCLLAVAMSVYVSRLRHSETVKPPPAKPTQHVSPPVTGPTERVTIYVAHDDRGELRAQSMSIPLSSGRQSRAEELLRSLINLYVQKDSPHRLAAGAEVRDVYMVEPGFAVIDVNSAVADGQPSGVLAEELTVVSMIQTLAANIPGLLRAKILVDGKERETLAGHADLSGSYDISEVSELARQLSVQ